MEPTIYADPESNVVKAERSAPHLSAKFAVKIANLAAVEPHEFAASSVLGLSAVRFATQQQPELLHSANQLSDLCSLDQRDHSFQGYAVSIEPMNSRGEGDLLASWKRKHL